MKQSTPPTHFSPPSGSAQRAPQEPHTKIRFFATALKFFFCAQVAQSAVLDILPGTNNVPIASVTYSIDGAAVVQASEATSIIARRDAPVLLTSVIVNDGSPKTLNFYNTLGATVSNLNISPSATGVGVFKNGTITNVSATVPFPVALAGTTQDTDLMNSIFYDGTTGLPDASTSDFDILFTKGLLGNDYMLVSERNGNTFFTIVPLNGAGEVIEGANSLRFGGSATLDAHQVYDWRSGYAADTYQRDQDFGFSVANVGKFFEDTDVAIQPVFGFRIDNNGDADVKFFGLSDSPFGDNPDNPILIPEPSAVLLFSIGILALLRRRRCRTNV